MTSEKLFNLRPSVNVAMEMETSLGSFLPL